MWFPTVDGARQIFLASERHKSLPSCFMGFAVDGSLETNLSTVGMYGGPEGPCPLPNTIFSITNFDLSHYQLPIRSFSHY